MDSSCSRSTKRYTINNKVSTFWTLQNWISHKQHDGGKDFTLPLWNQEWPTSVDRRLNESKPGKSLQKRWLAGKLYPRLSYQKCGTARLRVQIRVERREISVEPLIRYTILNKGTRGKSGVCHYILTVLESLGFASPTQRQSFRMRILDRIFLAFCISG